MNGVLGFIIIIICAIFLMSIAESRENEELKRERINRKLTENKLKNFIKDLIYEYLDISYKTMDYYSLPDNFIEILENNLNKNFQYEGDVINLYNSMKYRKEFYKLIRVNINESITSLKSKHKSFITVSKEDVKYQFKNWLEQIFSYKGFSFSYGTNITRKKTNNLSYRKIINDFIKDNKPYEPFESRDEADDLREEINDFIQEQNCIVNSDGSTIDEAIELAYQDFSDICLIDLIHCIMMETTNIELNASVLPDGYQLCYYYPIVKPLKFLYEGNDKLYLKNLEQWKQHLKYHKYLKNCKTLIEYRKNLINIFNTQKEDIEHKYSAREVLKIYEDKWIGKYNITTCINLVINNFLETIEFPEYLNFKWDINYDIESKIVLIDLYLPNSNEFPCYKDCKRITKDAKKIELNNLSSKAIEEIYEKYIYTLILNLINGIFNFEISLEEIINDNTYNQNQFLNDYIKNIAVNGIVQYVDDSDGQYKESCILSILTSEEEFSKIDISNVDYVKCFKRLKGVSSSNLAENVTITPIITFNKNDKRFIEGKEVLSTLNEGVNLASMDWQDFENLVRDLFEKEFCIEGSEVKITQSSHDGGVDAVVFDPDPIRGGKIVIQAKRYTNVVNVSAVRDLYGTVHNEGANKGILVTTSNFGADSHNFAKDKPITLINGSQLLNLLEKHNVNARIDIKEAKKILNAQKEVINE